MPGFYRDLGCAPRSNSISNYACSPCGMRRFFFFPVSTPPWLCLASHPLLAVCSQVARMRDSRVSAVGYLLLGSWRGGFHRTSLPYHLSLLLIVPGHDYVKMCFAESTAMATYPFAPARTAFFSSSWGNWASLKDSSRGRNSV